MHENDRKQVQQGEVYDSETFISTHFIDKSEGEKFILLINIIFFVLIQHIRNDAFSVRAVLW